MESDNEGSPLLNTLDRASWRSGFKRRCLRIPSEITITGVILGLFLIVVSLLILLQNLQTSKDTDLVIEDNLVGSSMKYELNSLGKTWQEKVNAKKDKNKDKDVNKRTERLSTISIQGSPIKNEVKPLGKSWGEEDDSKKTKEKEKNKDKNVDKRTERLSTSSVLQSPFKYNKKDQDSAWKEKKEFFIPSENDRKWDKVDKGWKTFSSNENLLGSSMKFNKKDLDQSWKDKKDFYIHKNDDAPWIDESKNWDHAAVNLLGSPMKLNKKDLDQSWKDKKDFYVHKNDDAPWIDENKSWEDIFADLLKSPLKFNKKDLDKSWQEKKDLYRPSDYGQKWDNVDKGWKHISYDFLDPSYENMDSDKAKEEVKDAKNKKWDNVNKGWKKISDSHLLGWNGKDIEAALLDSWIDGQEFLKSHLTSDNVKWDQVDDGWKKLAEQGWTDMNIKEALIQAWKKGLGMLKSRLVFDNKTWKKITGGWQNFSNHSKSVAAPSMCPISLLNREKSLGAPVPQEQIDCALIAEEMRKTLGRCVDLSFLPKECKPTWRVKCFTTYKYRKADGTCNNKIHPTWGQAKTPFVRMTEPDYADGVSAIRVAKNGKKLPNARLLSRKLYSQKLRPDSNTTVLFLIFGLLVDHDMVQTGIDTSLIPCCNEQFQFHPQSRPRECLQIDVPKDDPFYGPRNVTCLNLVRSLPVHGECMGRREQLNQATSFLDASTIYGSGLAHMKSLRSFNKGQLKTQIINNAPFMSFAENSRYSCGTPEEPLKCFAAGDSRANMLVDLTAMHTVWYREHNRLAEALHKLNPKWTDEVLFQEARRLLIAELQHIVYNELLPLLLGDKALEKYELKINANQTYEGYDETLDPRVYNVFGAAAFRFGHSLVQEKLKLFGPGNTEKGQISLHETFFNPHFLYHNALDLLIRGATLQSTHSVDSYITPEIREHLFQPAGVDYGHDLAAVSIQRGRDHGLPGFTKWREICGLATIKEWDDLYEIMHEKRADRLKEVYESVEDIDLVPGSLAEEPVTGSLLGPTHLCIIARQFKKTRKGDRFWFENQNQLGSFTEDQLQEIYKSSMARIICDNADSIQSVQKNSFEIPSESNPIISCEEIPSVDLSKWN